MFNTITIIGCGLIGSSLLRAINKNNLANRIKVFDNSKTVSSYLSKNFSSLDSKNLSCFFEISVSE